jgi:hypothetical protein
VTNITYGLIVEGPYDKAIYEALIPRVCRENPSFKTRVCNGVSELRKKFPIRLRDLEKVLQGNPVDKALVIRDSGGKDPTAIKTEMEESIHGMAFAFPRGVKLCIIRRTMETWLLADAEAISTVALARGGRQIEEVQGTLEDIHDPKERLRSLLSRAGLDYTDQVCAEIASHLRIDHLEYRCPSFRTFRQSVIDC